MLKLNSLSGFGSGVSGAAGVTPVNGYWIGGNDGSATDTADRIVFATGVTAAHTDANFDTVKTYHSAISDPQGGNGYSSGGYDGNATDTTEKTVYSTGATSAATDTDLATAENAAASFGDGLGTAGYFIGGQYKPGNNFIAQKLTYATETYALSSDADFSIGIGRKESTSVSDNALAGYTSGGEVTDEVPDGGDAYTVTTEKTVFATSTTAAATDANLSQARGFHGSLSDASLAGFFLGGAIGGGNFSLVADKLTFATETMATATDADLSATRYYMRGHHVSDKVNGYIAGGSDSSYNRLSLCERLVFATDTTATHTDGDLSSAKWTHHGMSDGIG
jgi:hypothetical protein